MASKFYFNLKEAKIFKAVKWHNLPIFRWAGLAKKVFLIFTFFNILLYFLITPTDDSFSGLAFIFLSFTFWFLIIEAFFKLKLVQPKFKENGKNLAEFLDFQSARAVWQSLLWSKNRRFPEINSSILFYYLLCNNPEIDFIFHRALVDPEQVKGTIIEYLESQFSEASLWQKIKSREISYSTDFQETINEALKTSQQRNHQRITVGDLITSLSKNNPLFREILIKFNLKYEDIENLCWWQERIAKKIAKKKRFWDKENLTEKGSFANDWAAGYTITLDKYSTDWSAALRKFGFKEAIGHDKELAELERILSRMEINNVLLIGKPGSGRKTIVQALAMKSLLGQSLPEINHKRIVQLDLTTLLSDIDNFEEVEETINSIFTEVVSAGNIILVINDFDSYIGGQIRPGVIDISGLISPFLRLPQFQIIAITDYSGLHKNIEPNTALIGLFEKVEVSEISEKATIMILEDLVPLFESRHKKFISYPVLRNIVVFSSRYLPASPFPKKAIDLLDEIMVYACSQKKKRLVLAEDVAEVISAKTQVPVGEIESKEREVLLNLESLLHQRIVNQEEAIKEVASALRRARVELKERKRPMGCFLFLGPTGVGKTETAKALAEFYFHSEAKIIRLDMSEFQDVQDIPRLIGSAEQEGLLTTRVNEDPFSLLLLDEIEKTHPNILNLFLQILDEGHITDGLGRKTSFRNCIIIATSNAGAQIIWEDVRLDKKLDIIKEDLLDILFKKKIFRPEFINRFDAIVVFKPLTKENLLAIADLMLSRIKKDLEKEKDIEFSFDNELKQRIVDFAYNPAFGAREMNRVIADRIENVLALALLKKEINRGDKIKINPESFGIIKESKN